MPTGCVRGAPLSTQSQQISGAAPPRWQISVCRASLRIRRWCFFFVAASDSAVVQVFFLGLCCVMIYEGMKGMNDILVGS